MFIPNHVALRYIEEVCDLIASSPVQSQVLYDYIRKSPLDENLPYQWHQYLYKLVSDTHEFLKEKTPLLDIEKNLPRFKKPLKNESSPPADEL